MPTGVYKKRNTGNRFKIEPLENKYVVDKNTGCWIWIRGGWKSGYAGFTKNNKHYRAHRYLYEIYKGKIEKGMVIDHLCRNRKCVNPDHLEAVSIKENVRRGLSAKLNMEIVSKIRKMYSDGLITQQKLANLFGVGKRAISKIVNMKRWI